MLSGGKEQRNNELPVVRGLETESEPSLEHECAEEVLERQVNGQFFQQHSSRPKPADPGIERWTAAERTLPKGVLRQRRNEPFGCFSAQQYPQCPQTLVSTYCFSPNERVHGAITRIMKESQGLEENE